MDVGSRMNSLLVQAYPVPTAELAQLYVFTFNNPVNTYDIDGSIAPLPIIMAGNSIGNCVIAAYEMYEYAKCMNRGLEINQQATRRLPPDQAIAWCRNNRGQQCKPLLDDALKRGSHCILWGAGRFLLLKAGLNPVIGGKLGGQ
jgi:hypothetical protein